MLRNLMSSVTVQHDRRPTVVVCTIQYFVGTLVITGEVNVINVKLRHIRVSLSMVVLALNSK